VRISVIIPVFDGARWLAEALESARGQTLPPDEIVVVDDGSRDGSADLARRVPGVRVVEMAHAGVSSARNRGLAEATGDIIAWLDVDDVWAPEKLEVQVGLLEERPELGYTLCNQRVVLEPGMPRPGWLPPPWMDDNAPCGGTCALVARAWAFERVGGFDPARHAGEDLDWMVRATEAGVAMAVVPRPLIVRRVHERNLTHSASQNEMLGALRGLIARRRGGAS
jgi:glycosyltransferase involved in cell wall biosynthesis